MNMKFSHFLFYYRTYMYGVRYNGGTTPFFSKPDKKLDGVDTPYFAFRAEKTLHVVYFTLWGRRRRRFFSDLSLKRAHFNDFLCAQWPRPPHQPAQRPPEGRSSGRVSEITANRDLSRPISGAPAIGPAGLRRPAGGGKFWRF